MAPRREFEWLLYAGYCVHNCGPMGVVYTGKTMKANYRLQPHAHYRSVVGTTNILGMLDKVNIERSSTGS